MVKYVVRLHPEEHVQLLALVNTGRAAAVKRLPARIVLKAAVGADSRHWSEAESAEAVDTSAATVHRGRQACGERGRDAALSRKRPAGRQYRQRDGAQEAQLRAGACRAPPAGRGRWTLKLLADKRVARAIGDTSSTACVRTTLKKMRSTHGRTNHG